MASYAVALIGASVAGIALLQAEERGVAAAAAQQVVMPAALDDLAGLDHQDRVGVHDGVQAMGDDDGGAVLAEMLDRLLHLLFGLRIERRGGLVEQDDRRVLDQRPRHRDALALAAGELRAMLADRGVVAERKAHDELMRAGGLRGLDDLGVGGADLPKAMLARTGSRNR